MKKPELKDFNLTEQDFNKLADQRELFSKRKALYIENKQKSLKKIILGILILSLLIAIFVGISESDKDLPLSIFLFGGLVAFLVYIFWEKDEISNTKRDEIYYQCVNRSLENRIQAYNNAIYEYEREEEKLSRQFWINLSGYAFEKEVAKLYERLGYTTQVTQKSGDGGVDIILKKGNEKIAIQCKHHSKPVGPAPVRELMGVVASHDYDRGIFVSLNGFTSTVYKELESSYITIDLLSLEDILLLSRKHSKIKEIQKPSKTANIPTKPTTTPYKTVKKEETQTKPLIQDKPQNTIPTKQSEDAPIKKHCVGNCSTCNRDTCIYDT